MSTYQHIKQCARESAAQRQFLRHIESGYVADRPHEITEIAALLGISRRRVAQIESLANRKLKLALKGCSDG